LPCVAFSCELFSLFKTLLAVLDRLTGVTDTKYIRKHTNGSTDSQPASPSYITPSKYRDGDRQTPRSIPAPPFPPRVSTRPTGWRRPPVRKGREGAVLWASLREKMAERFKKKEPSPRALLAGTLPPQAFPRIKNLVASIVTAAGQVPERGLVRGLPPC